MEAPASVAKVVPQGYVDLGLPSGTLWKNRNESGFYDYDKAVRSFGNKLPTEAQLVELKNVCTWEWTGSGYNVTGPNGNKIYLPAAGFRLCDGSVYYVGTGDYWSSTPSDSELAWDLYFNSSGVHVNYEGRCVGQSVRLVQD